MPQRLIGLQMALPKTYEILEEETGYSGKKKVHSYPALRPTRCSGCDQEIERVRDGDVLRIPPHNRRVFRRMKNGYPDWVLEACPNGVR